MLAKQAQAQANIEDASPLRLVVLISGNGSNLQAILDNIAAGALSAQVAAVISDRADAGGLVRAKRADVPAVVIARRDYADAESFYDALLRQVASFTPDLVVLAGFMRILPTAFVAQFADRILNIHPSLLPKFKGLNTHQRALDAGEHRHGASVHLVTEGLDEGPILAQVEVDIRPGDDAETLAARVLAEEHRIYSRVIQQFAERHHAGVEEAKC